MTDGSPQWAAFVEQQLKAERDRRAAVDARGQSVVTTSASLVTLLVAVGAFVSGQDKYQFPRAALFPLLATVILFTAAAFLGILATLGRTHQVADNETLTLIPEHLGESDNVATKNIVFSNVLTTRTLRSGNNKKTTLLGSALFGQLAALISLAVTISVMILDAW